MHANLAPGERLLPGTAEAAAALLAREGVEAVLVPLAPEGDASLARAARRYVAAWDRRFVHRMNFFAPASRVLTRAPLSGWRNADAAPVLADAIARGGLVEALPSSGVATPIARDLEAWRAWAAEEGAAWGALAAREPRFAPFLPVLSRAAWWRHNVLHHWRRDVEALEAVRRPDALALLLHLVREATWTGACRRAFAAGGTSSGGARE